MPTAGQLLSNELDSIIRMRNLPGGSATAREMMHGERPADDDDDDDDANILQRTIQAGDPLTRSTARAIAVHLACHLFDKAYQAQYIAGYLDAPDEPRPGCDASFHRMAQDYHVALHNTAATQKPNTAVHSYCFTSLLHT